MQYFRDVQWELTLHEEPYTQPNGNQCTIAYYTISDWKIPFSYEEWVANIGFSGTGPENIYEYCSKRLSRPLNKTMVLEAGSRLDNDPGFVHGFEKMASFYILRLLASIPSREVWKQWPKIPMTDALLQDEVFCLCVVALHPVLYGKLHPIGRNNRRVCLEAIALWDLPKYSLMQFAHPYTMRTFGGKPVNQLDIGCHLQSHTDCETQYWVFEDYSVMTRAIGKPGARRWFEMEFMGPQVVKRILQERTSHGNSVENINPFISKNVYVT